ncbi:MULTISPECIES: hypothetical protein [unclassified Ruegeria]|uniref:hypothetical protein n=1 Tax=unclassified Ruegeria TaxID=2625375 RepID=UPI0014930E41|nr:MULTISPECIES: hypothetical protein [unclassified Ruegeria]NOD35427.1 hypothetical protein [Ruegeria sp. HKCCD7296]
MIVAGLDLAKRSDHSALVIIEAIETMKVTHALRLPHRPYREQIELLKPALSGVDHLAFDSTGVGDAVGEMLSDINATGVVTTGCSRKLKICEDGRIMISKQSLIGGISSALACGQLRVASNAPGRADLAAEMTAFVTIPRSRKIEARQGHHDDLVMALGLAVLAANPTVFAAMF